MYSKQRHTGTLTWKEKETLELIRAGLSSQEVSEILTVEISTTRSHLRHIYKKLGVHNRTEAIGKYYG
jgi:LuxR family transcriptional regulator, maltose regulon positive regulatory protein